MSENKNNGSTVIPWKEFAKGERPDYNVEVILLTQKQEVTTGKRTHTDSYGDHYMTSSERPESDFIAWVHRKVIADSGPKPPTATSSSANITPNDPL